MEGWGWGLCLAKVLEDSPRRGRKTLGDGALRQIIELIQQVAKQWGGREIMSPEILIDLECSLLTRVDEIYSYQVFFFMMMIIIQAVWRKPVAIFVFYLNLQLFKIALRLHSG